jgi:hypothetical protein
MIFVISGIKTTQGIANWVNAIIVLEKYDPSNILVPVGTIRTFQEMDELAANATWGAFKPTGLSNVDANILLNYLQAPIQPNDVLTNSQKEGK